MSAAATVLAPVPAAVSAGTVKKSNKRKRRITEEDFDLTVDIDSEIEDSLGPDINEYNCTFNKFLEDKGLTDIDYDDYLALKEEFLEAQSRYLPPRDVERWDIISNLQRKGIEWWLKEYLVNQCRPVQELLLAFGVFLDDEHKILDDLALLPLLKAALIRCTRLRRRRHFDTTPRIGRITEVIENAKNIVILTGAGISTSCGIPDFRSRDGLYSQLSHCGLYDLDDPQQMFDINYFKRYPDVFYSFSHKIYPSNFNPSPCHRFIKAMQDRNKLLRNYTQNIDTLEQKAGITRLLQCHGSFQTASCIHCCTQVPGESIKEDLLASRVPLCKYCNDPTNAAKPKRIRKKKKRKRNDGWESDDEELTPPLPPGIMKPDITFFGEKLSREFDKTFFQDVKKMDLLLIIGTSLKVRPVSEITSYIPLNVPIIVINKTLLTHVNVDVQLLGDADTIVELLARKLGWDISPPDANKTDPVANLEPPKKRKIKRRLVGPGHGLVLFEGYEDEEHLQKKLQNCADTSWYCTDGSEGEDSDHHKARNVGKHHPYWFEKGTKPRVRLTPRMTSGK